MRLKINIEALLKSDAEIHGHLDPDWLGRELGEVMVPEGGGEGEVHLKATRLKDLVQVEGEITGRFFVLCGRCLGPAAILAEVPFFMVFQPAQEVKDQPAELELSEADLHWDSYSGPELDLTPFVREQLLLAVPMSPLCGEDCTGIPYERPIEDEAGSDGADPRWKALANLKPSR